MVGAARGMIDIVDLEAAINHWRARAPAADGAALSPQLQALAEVYGQMVWAGVHAVDASTLPPQAWQAWLDWYATTPDTPCIAICSTSQGDAVCKGCGRTFDEVQHWTALDPVAKRAVWRRISTQATALRFTRYRERARG
ncbi:MAG: hypothetical protein OHK0048_08130 [Rhodoferax sp.]